jgi:hypothetical protein
MVVDNPHRNVGVIIIFFIFVLRIVTLKQKIMKKLMLLGLLLLSLTTFGQYGKNKDKPSLFYAGIANYDLRHSDNVGVSVGINYYCIYAEANTNAIFNSNRTDIVNYNMGYSFFFLNDNLALIPTVGVSCTETHGVRNEKFNTGFIMQAKVYKPLYIYTGVGKFDGMKIGLALKLD